MFYCYLGDLADEKEAKNPIDMHWRRELSHSTYFDLDKHSNNQQ